MKRLLSATAGAKKPLVDYTTWSRESLINKLNKIDSRLAASTTKREPTPPKKRYLDNTLQASRYPRAHIALRISYLGWKYNGFATQISLKSESDEDPLKRINELISSGIVTVEDLLFKALLKTKLIESPRTCNYSRCGRTDTGVSAMNQVIGLTIRSQTKSDSVDPSDTQTEVTLPILRMLNRCLPDDIRVTGWSPAVPSFDARFSCIGRKYKYYFNGSSLDIEKMREACLLLEGLHDFSSFCRKGKNSTKDICFTRRIITCSITKMNDSFYCFDIHGSSFLYHQVRCTMEILFLIGRGVETPEIINKMLALKDYDHTLQYDIASEIPLILDQCLYDQEKTPLNWRCDSEESDHIKGLFFHIWQHNYVKQLTVKRFIDNIDNGSKEMVGGMPTSSRIYSTIRMWDGQPFNKFKKENE